MSILAIDPGTTESGWCVYNGYSVLACGVMPNDEMLAYVERAHHRVNGYRLALEMIASYGMPVGREVFETCVFIGRLIEAWAGKFRKVYRQDVKLHGYNHVDEYVILGLRLDLDVQLLYTQVDPPCDLVDERHLELVSQ